MTATLTLSDAWHTTSWLDHCFCSADAHDSIEAVIVNYEFATINHVPFSLSVDMDCVPAQIPVDNNLNMGKIAWDNLSEKYRFDYSNRTQCSIYMYQEMPSHAMILIARTLNIALIYVICQPGITPYRAHVHKRYSYMYRVPEHIFLTFFCHTQNEM